MIKSNIIDKDKKSLIPSLVLYIWSESFQSLMYMEVIERSVTRDITVYKENRVTSIYNIKVT